MPEEGDENDGARPDGGADGGADGRFDDDFDSGSDVDAPLVLALDVADPVLRDRLARLLGEVPGLHLLPGDGAAADDGVRAADATVVAARPGPPDGTPELTPRELEVLDVLAEGASNPEIAQRLGISVHTVKFHVGSILDKLDSSGRTDAVAYALRLGVLRL